MSPSRLLAILLVLLVVLSLLTDDVEAARRRRRRRWRQRWRRQHNRGQGGGHGRGTRRLRHAAGATVAEVVGNTTMTSPTEGEAAVSTTPAGDAEADEITIAPTENTTIGGHVERNRTYEGDAEGERHTNTTLTGDTEEVRDVESNRTSAGDCLLRKFCWDITPTGTTAAPTTTTTATAVVEEGARNSTHVRGKLGGGNGRNRTHVRRRGGRRRSRAHSSGKRAEFVRRRLKKAGRNKEGSLRLIDGRADWEGNVQIYHDGRWGNICDDEWDNKEGQMVCKALGFPDIEKVTYSGIYGHAKAIYWLDNLFCVGTEKNLGKCRHDGWGIHDCESNEAAGVVCKSHFTPTEVTPTLPPRDEPRVTNKVKLAHVLEGKLKLRLRGGRNKQEGRVEVKLPGNSSWGLLCGDGWSLLEGMVVCRQLGLKYAQGAVSTGYFGGNQSDIVISGIKCTGNEARLEQCLHDSYGDVFCPDPSSDPNIAGVTCVDKMADLVPDHIELARSAHLEDKQLFFLQCAMEENCLAASATESQDSGYGWHLEVRRLLRFTARIVNQGDEAFRPFLPKQYWIWHGCHMHYHSMEVFAHYDIIDSQGNRVAEGHKASFCLEDNNCLPGVQPVFKCANFGDQGISPGCTDTYAFNIDCQWVDITDLKPGKYTFKLAINPEWKVAEQNFDNNAAVCELIYREQHVWMGNCSLARP